MSKTYTMEGLLKHSKREDFFVSIRGGVYDVSSFVADHPGGDEVLVDVAGQEATEAYDDAGHSDEADKILERYLVGKLDAPRSVAAGETRNKGGKSQGGLGTTLLWIAAALIGILVAGIVISVMRVGYDL